MANTKAATTTRKPAAKRATKKRAARKAAPKATVPMVTVPAFKVNGLPAVAFRGSSARQAAWAALQAYAAENANAQGMVQVAPFIAAWVANPPTAFTTASQRTGQGHNPRGWLGLFTSARKLGKHLTSSGQTLVTMGEMQVPAK